MQIAVRVLLVDADVLFRRLCHVSSPQFVVWGEPWDARLAAFGRKRVQEVVYFPTIEAWRVDDKQHGLTPARQLPGSAPESDRAGGRPGGSPGQLN